MATLTEGAIFQHNGATLTATWMVGTWVLLPMRANGAYRMGQPGELAALRLVAGEWREMLVDQDDADQLVWGNVVDLDLDALAAVADGEDEQFLALMGELQWEWN